MQFLQESIDPLDINCSLSFINKITKIINLLEILDDDEYYDIIQYKISHAMLISPYWRSILPTNKWNFDTSNTLSKQFQDKKNLNYKK